jgi:type IV secretion system protein VirB10
MTDEETGFELDEQAAEEEWGDAGEEREPEGDEAGGTEGGPPEKKDAREAVRLNKAPWINRRFIFMALAVVAAITVLISLIGPGKAGRKKTEPARNAPDTAVPDFGDYRERAYRAGAEPPTPDALREDPPEEEPPPFYPPPPPRTQQRQPETPASGPVRDFAAEAEYAARVSPLLPPVQGRLLGMSPVEYTTMARVQDGPLSPEEYMRDRLSALYGSGGMPAGTLAAGMPPGGGEESSSYERQNMQENKQAFYSEGRGGTITGSFIGEDTVWNGTVIPAVLITGINTDLPGDVQARVTANIYDSLTGKKLLIPQGTILIASYNSSVSFAQSRVQVAWNTLIRPDGYQAELGNMNAVDRRGFSGTRGQINDHLFQYVKAAGIISAFTLLNGEISYNTAAVNNPGLQNLIAANQGVVNQFGAGVINRALDIQPTLRVKNGEQINVMVNKNIWLPPLKDYSAPGPYRRR